MNYNEIINFDTGNCHGISITLFVSGCHLHCSECHNKQTWDFNGGKLFTNNTIEEILDKLKSPHISYFVLSGGNPVEKENIETVLNLCRRVKELNKKIICYSGYTMKELKELYPKDKLSYFNYIIDGRFDKTKVLKGLDLRGSYNQQCYENKDTYFLNISQEYFKEIYPNDVEQYHNKIFL